MLEKFELGFSITVSVVVLAIVAAMLAARTANSEPMRYPSTNTIAVSFQEIAE